MRNLPGFEKTSRKNMLHHSIFVKTADVFLLYLSGPKDFDFYFWDLSKQLKKKEPEYLNWALISEAWQESSISCNHSLRYQDCDDGIGDDHFIGLISQLGDHNGFC